MPLNRPLFRIQCPSYFDGYTHHPEGACFVIQNGIIVAIEPLAESSNIQEYWCPGWVNLHAHLELTHLFQKLPQKVPFPDWVQSLQAITRSWSPADFCHSFQQGLDQSLSYGVTTLYDVGNAHAAAENSSIRLFPLPEVLGWPNPSTLYNEPCVPHALYSTHPQRIAHAIQSCQKNGYPWSIHLAESQAEQDLLTQGEGPFRSFLDMRFPHHPFQGVGARPFARLQKIFQEWSLSHSPGFIVHGNFLNPQELQNMATHGWPLVHCPQSREWFGHPLPDFAECRQQGVDLCIATDSLASAHSLDPRAQLRTLEQHSPGFFSAEQKLSMISGIPGQYLGNVGRLQVGSPADFVCLRLPPGTPPSHLPEIALLPSATILSVWVQGQPLFHAKDSKP